MSNLKELKAVQGRLVKDRKRAEGEVKKIESTLQKIEAAISELQGVSKKEKSPSTKGAKGEVGRRTWTEEQKREAAERMKRIWAKKKRAKKKAERDGLSESQGGEGAAVRPEMVVPPQAVA